MVSEVRLFSILRNESWIEVRDEERKACCSPAYLYVIGIVDDQYPGSIRVYADLPSRIHRSIPASSGCAASDTSRCGYLSCAAGDAFLYALPVGRCY